MNSQGPNTIDQNKINSEPQQSSNQQYNDQNQTRNNECDMNAYVDENIDQTMVMRQAILDADVRTQRQLQGSILAPQQLANHQQRYKEMIISQTKPLSGQKQKILQTSQQRHGNGGLLPQTSTSRAASLPPLIYSPNKNIQADQSFFPTTSAQQHAANIQALMRKTPQQRNGSDGSALVSPEQLYVTVTKQPQPAPTKLHQFNINITGNQQIIQNPQATLGVNQQAAAMSANIASIVANKQFHHYGGDIQMGIDGKFYASTKNSTTSFHQNSELSHVSPHFSNKVSPLIQSSNTQGRESSQCIGTQQNNTKLQIVEKPIGQQSRFGFHKKGQQNTQFSSSSPQALKSNKILSATNQNQSQNQRRDSCGPIIVSSNVSRKSPLPHQQSGLDSQQKFYTTNGGLFVDPAQASICNDGVSMAAKSTPQQVQGQTMTNRLPNFIAIPRNQPVEQNTAANQSSSSQPPPMLVSGFQQLQIQHQLQDNNQQHRFTLLKARGEQGSKQLKHDVAQQIIDSNAAAPAHHNFRKQVSASAAPSSVKQNTQTQIVSSRPGPMVGKLRSDLCSPMQPGGTLGHHLALPSVAADLAENSTQMQKTGALAAQHNILMTPSEQLLLNQHQNYSNQLKQATNNTSNVNSGSGSNQPPQFNMTYHSNSMELLLANKTVHNDGQRNKSMTWQQSQDQRQMKHTFMQQPNQQHQQSTFSMANYQTSKQHQLEQNEIGLKKQNGDQNNTTPVVGMVKGLSYRMMSEKRASQPPVLHQNSGGNGAINQFQQESFKQKRTSREQLLLHAQQLEQMRRTSVLTTQYTQNHQMGQPSVEDITGVPRSSTITSNFNVFMQGGAATGDPPQRHSIYKQEVSLLDTLNVNNTGAVVQTQQQQLQGQSAIILPPESVEWIKKAIQASQQQKTSSEDQAQDNQPQMAQSIPTGRQGQQAMALGQPTIQIPQGTSIMLTQRNSASNAAFLAPDYSPQSPKNTNKLQQQQRPDLTDSNVKRTRLLLDKKKKQFSKQLQLQQQSSSLQGPTDDPRWRLSHQNYTLLDNQEVATNRAEAMSPTTSGSLAGADQFVDGILIGSGIAAAANSNINQNLHQANFNSPMATQSPKSNSKMTFTTTSTNTANQSLNNNMIAVLNRRGIQQERAFQQNQGIQGRNMTIVSQSSANSHNLIKKKNKAATVESQGASNDEQEIILQVLLQHQIGDDPEDLKALEFIQNNLQQYHQCGNSETEKIKVKQQQSPNKNPPRKELIVFSHDGQTYLRNNETQSTNSKMLYVPVNIVNTKKNQTEKQQQEENLRREQLEKVEEEKAKILEQIQIKASQSPKLANLFSQLQINNPQSDSESTQGNGLLSNPQFETALQQLIKMQRGSGLNPSTIKQHSLTSNYVLEGTNRPPLVQTMTLNGAAVLAHQSLIPQGNKGTAKRHMMLPGGNKATRTTGAFSHKYHTNTELQSNASLSTKPATSTTLNSTTGASPIKKSQQKGKNNQREQQPQKQKVQIYHEWWHEADNGILKTHKINKAINTINNIIRLIFKNSKDSQALTATNNGGASGGGLNGPAPNRLMDDTRITELQKIAKQININIPRKQFDSKASLREFFYSREFILNVKIKMQNLLHKAILSANNLNQNIIEANMCGNLSLVTATASDTTGTNHGATNNAQAGSNTKNGADSHATEHSTNQNKIYQAKKFHVGPGNNFPIVKSVLKQRYWWQYGAEESFAADCDFIWTAWKKQKHIDFLSNVPKTSPIINKDSAQQKTLKVPSLASSTQDPMRKSSKKHLLQESSSMTKLNKNSRSAQQNCCNIEKVVLPLRLYNKLEQNKQLTNKKGVFVNMRRYYESMGQDPFKVLPLTFHTQHGVNDPEYHKFESHFYQVEKRYRAAEQNIKQAIRQYFTDKNGGKVIKPKAGEEDYEYGSEIDSDDEEAIEKIKQKYRVPQNTWIVKPGENSNRGQGITVVKSLREIQQIIGRPLKKDGERTFIIQKYIDYPLLVHRRKFDFRCYGLLTSINGSLKGYCYQDGYIRTSCREYSLDDVSDQFVHLTNDAIQQKADDYGKFENGNKLSWQDFTKVVCAQQPNLDFDFHRDIFPQIQKLIADTYKATFTKIDPQRLQNCFELFGYDFMIDENFRLYLIEVNTNPCLEVCCPLLARIIPEVLDNCFKIVLDPLFPSPDLSHNRKFQLNELPQEVKFQLVFDESTQGEQIKANTAIKKGSNPGVEGFIREASERQEDEDIESDKECELMDDEDADNY